MRWRCRRAAARRQAAVRPGASASAQALQRDKSASLHGNPHVAPRCATLTFWLEIEAPSGTLTRISQPEKRGAEYAMNLLGIDIGGTKTSVCVGTDAGVIRASGSPLAGAVVGTVAGLWDAGTGGVARSGAFRHGLLSLCEVIPARPGTQRGRGGRQ